MAQQQRSYETRAQILDAAARCFAHNGYNATGVAEICTRAGVSKGAFYYHFPSKQAVFLALLDAWMVELEAALETMAGGARTAPERLSRMARLMGVILQSESARLPMFLEFWAQASRDGCVHQVTVGPYRKFQKLFGELIQSGIDEGTLAPVNPASGAQAIISLASGLLLQGLLNPGGADWGQVSEESIHILLQGLERR